MTGSFRHSSLISFLSLSPFVFSLFLFLLPPLFLFLFFSPFSLFTYERTLLNLS